MDKTKVHKDRNSYLVVFAAILAIPVQQPVRAGGFQDGLSEAEQDFNRSNGQDKDPGCSPENGVEYCTQYKLGYESRWAHMWTVFDCSSGEC
jgi:hypothetical protein